MPPTSPLWLVIIKDVTALLAAIATFGAALAAIWWFVKRGPFRSRIEFAVRCNLTKTPQPGVSLAEVIVTVENKGEVTHRLDDMRVKIWPFAVATVGADPFGSNPIVKQQIRASMWDPNIKAGSVDDYFVVRAGIRQDFRVEFLIATPTAPIKVTARFTYREPKRNLWGHLKLDSAGKIQWKGDLTDWHGAQCIIFPSDAESKECSAAS